MYLYIDCLYIFYKSYIVIEIGGVFIYEVIGEINFIVVCMVYLVGCYRCMIWYIWIYKDEWYLVVRYVIKYGKEN